MRRLKKDRHKPIPVADLEQIAKFRAELGVYNRLITEGKTHEEATRIVFAEDLE